jgi:hypothetical protein
VFGRNSQMPAMKVIPVMRQDLAASQLFWLH